MVLIVNFDLKTKLYDIINIYVNVSLRKPIYYYMFSNFEYFGRI